MKKLISFAIGILLITSSFVHTGNTLININAAQTNTTLSESIIKDKLEGGWVGQMVGVAWGGSTEYKYTAKIIDDSFVPLWGMDMINNSFDQDDLFVEIPFLNAMKENGPDCSVEILGEYFKRSKFPLCHANLEGRNNLKKGITAPASGNYVNNVHCDDIDWMIEADFVGQMSPGMVNAAIAKAFEAGHVVCYGDGVYGGVFVAAMHAKAYTAANVAEIIEVGRQSVPVGSRFRALIEDIISWKNEGKTWEESWQLLDNKWRDDDRCPDYAGTCPEWDFKLNIDAKLNAGYVLLGLLYGNGDFEQSMRISMRCGQDSDCNPSTVGGILGNFYGLSKIPDQWKSSLKRTGVDFSYTNYSFDDAVTINLELAKKFLVINGGSIKDGIWTIPTDDAVIPPVLEQLPALIPLSLMIDTKPGSSVAGLSNNNSNQSSESVSSINSNDASSKTANGVKKSISFEILLIVILAVMLLAIASFGVFMFIKKNKSKTNIE